VGEAMEGDGGFGHGGAVKVEKLVEEVLGEVDMEVDKGTTGEAKTVHSILALLLTIMYY